MSADRALRLCAAGGLGLALALGACISERSGGPVATTGECRVPIAVVDSQHVVIAMVPNFQFTPDSVLVPAGTTVTWINCDDPGTEPHTTTSSTGLWNSGEYPAGARYSVAFPAQGVFPYLCTSHSGMIGKVVVQ